MAIDAEDVLVCIWRFLRFFMHTSNVCVQKHPLFSCILLLFFLVYIFFDLLLYHSPFLICIAILLRCFWSSELPPTTTTTTTSEVTVKEREKSTSPTTLLATSTIKEEVVNVVANRDSLSVGEGFSSVRRQKSRRTIVDRNREWKSQAGKKGNDNLFPPPTNDKNAKLVVKEREGFLFERGRGQSSSLLSSNSIGNNLHVVGSETSKKETLLPSDGLEQNQLKKSDSYSVVSEADNVEDFEDDDEEEEEEEAVKNGGNKAMEWTEDDQKNLMDLGLSEIERNRRLESLIAKRRARTLFQIQAEKGLIDLDGVVPTSTTIAPVFVSRDSPFEVPIGEANENESLQVPGSAPSILLPMQNPFDLPYDPLEEKPNLMADSFQQEFAAVNQKEMLYCRHESFSLGPFQYDHDHHHHHNHQDRRDFGNYFNSEKRAFEGYGLPRYKRQSGNQDTLMEQFLSEVGVSKPLNEHILESQARVLNSKTSKMDMELTEESNDETTSSSSSDMTNEAEVSSNIEPNQGNTKTNMSTTEEPNYDSSPTSNDKNRMENTMFFSDHQPRRRIHTPTFSIASDMQVEVSEAGSPSMTVGNMSPNDVDSLSEDVEMVQSNSTNFDCKSFDVVSQVMESVEKLRNIAASSSETMAFENQDTTTQLAARSSFEILSEGTEKSWSLPDESVKEGSVIYDEGDSVTEIIDHMEDHEKDEDEDEDGSLIVTRLTIEEAQQKPAEMRDLDSALHNDGNSENLNGHQAKDSSQLALEENMNLKDMEDSGARTEQEGISDMSKSVETEDKNLNRKDGVSSSDLNEEIDMDVPRSDLEELAKTSSLDEHTTDDTNLIMTQNGNYMGISSTTHISNTSDVETLEEPSSSEKFTDESNGNIISNTHEPALVNEKAAKEEPDTLLSTDVVTAFFGTPEVTGLESNEGCKNGTGKLAEGQNTHCITPEDDQLARENDLENEKMKFVEESRDGSKQDLSIESADVANDNLNTTKCVGIESDNMMENNLDIDQDHSSKIVSNINISISLNTTVEE
ncbi:hypothetical protein CsatA_007844 [Cannabis sativa]